MHLFRRGRLPAGRGESSIIDRSDPGRIVLVRGYSHDVVEEVRLHTPNAGLFFHDGAHSEHAYTTDFACYEPLLAPGAVLLYDDIRWEDARIAQTPSRTYEGWRKVVSHPRVRAAYELDGDLGLLQLH